MKLVCISDTHNLNRQLSLPKGDVLVCAGDFTGMGTLPEIIKFNTWLKTIQYDFKKLIIISGNHDWLFQTNSTLAIDTLSEDIDNLVYLEDEPYEFEGIKFYGSPVQPTFFSWAFNVDRGEPIKRVWAKIPDDTNVLITHGPPYNILDTTPYGDKVGCVDLSNRIKELKELKAHVFGHIHDAYGLQQISNVKYVNACNCNERYKLVNKPIVIEV